MHCRCVVLLQHLHSPQQQTPAWLQSAMQTCALYFCLFELETYVHPTRFPVTLTCRRQAPAALPGGLRVLPALPALRQRTGAAHAHRRGSTGGGGTGRGAHTTLLTLLLPWAREQQQQHARLGSAPALCMRCGRSRDTATGLWSCAEARCVSFGAVCVSSGLCLCAVVACMR